MTEAMGQALRVARERRGLSTQAVAEEASISVGYLSKLEHGTVTTPSPRVLQRLARVTRVDYWTLMQPAGYVPEGDEPPAAGPPAPSAGPATNERIVELLEAVRAEVAQLAATVRASG
jgi:transcriptional regulator with XRE-family HTH domain